MHTDDTFGDWFRWAVGLYFVVQCALTGHLYVKIDAKREDDLSKSGRDLKLVWLELSKLRESLDLDRQRAADLRATLAASLVTRDELDRQISRLLSTVNLHVAAVARMTGSRPTDIGP
jgi:septal ring factor EnvC (AmiA/AmiB activator)